MLADLFNNRAIGGVPWQAANDDGWGVWAGDPYTIGGSGYVDQADAFQLLAVYGSVSFITDEISTLPVIIDDAPRPAWVDRPAEGLDRIAWTSQLVHSLLMSGNAFIAVLGNPLDPAAMQPLDPTRVDVRMSGGRIQYAVAGEPARFPVIHIPGRMRPGSLVGLSPLEWCRQTIGAGIAATKYGAEFFDNDGNMPGVIEAPHPMQPETIRDLARQWQQRRRKGGRGLPGVLQNGAQWKSTSISLEQAQFLSTRKWNAAEIAGQIFMLDPSDLGIPVEGVSLTYANLEQRNVRRLQVALMPWIRRIESALSPWIPGGTYRFDVDSRLRGNTRESYETLAVAIEAGLLTTDEGRQILGLGPSPDQPMEVNPDG